MKKIQMTTPLVEMDGDEMTRILWKMIKEHLLEPFIDLNKPLSVFTADFRHFFKRRCIQLIQHSFVHCYPSISQVPQLKILCYAEIPLNLS